MNTQKHTFTVQDAINTQQEYLAKWKTVLQTWAYNKLAAYCQYQNSQLTSTSTGYDVFRGQDLDNYVTNNLTLKNNLYK